MPTTPSSRSGAVVIGGANVDVRARSVDRAVAGHQQPRHHLPLGRRGRSQRRGEPRPPRYAGPAGRRRRPRRRGRAAARGDRGRGRGRVPRRADRRGHRQLPRRARRRRRAGRGGLRHGRHRRRCSPTTYAAWSRWWPRPSCWCVDGNLAPPTLAACARPGPRHRTPVVLDPVSVPKAARLAALLTDGEPRARGHAEPRGARRPDRPHRDRGRRRPGRGCRPARPRRRRTSGCGSARPGRSCRPTARRRGWRPCRDRSSTSPVPGTRCSARSATA